jgi:hypothetical protein
MSHEPFDEHSCRSIDQEWQGEYLSLIKPDLASLSANLSAFNESRADKDHLITMGYKDHLITIDYKIDALAWVYHCESSVPSFCSDEECSDCSSIISSMTYQSIDDCAGEESTTPADLSTLRDEEAAPMTAFDFDLLPRHVLDRSISVVSAGTIPMTSNGSMFEGTEMDEDAISFISSTSSFVNDVEDMRYIQFSSWTCAPQASKPDVFRDLPDELVSSVASFLDVESLSQFCLVSKRARLVSSRDEAGWKQHCQSLWSQKAFVLKEARHLYQSRNAMSAYKLSIYDAKHRQELRPEELCFDARSGEGIVWEFRFKETAGADWTSFDPWWTGGKAREMVFLLDGTVKQIIQDHDSGTFALYQPFRDVTPEVMHLEASSQAPISHLEMTWRFVQQPMDLPKRASGSYLRLTVDGRDVPTYVVHRSPTGDWGFVVESCWGVFSSTPLPRRQILDSQHPPIRRARMRLRRTRDGARWLNVDGIETDSEDEGEEIQPRPNVDSTFSMSTRSQWREALLYNYGAISLPEGEHATAEFDRVWSQSFRRGRTQNS